MLPVSFAIFGIFYIFAALIGLGISVLIYVLTALGIKGMAAKLGFEHPAYAFIPVYNLYMIGSVATACAVRNGSKPRKYGKILIGIWIGITVASLLFGVTTGFAAGLGIMSEYGDGDIMPYRTVSLSTDPDAATTGMAAPAIIILLLCFIFITIVFSAVTVLYMVFYYMALWQIFQCFARDNAIIFLLLSIVFSVTLPFFIFSLRNAEPKPAPSAPAYTAG